MIGPATSGAVAASSQTLLRGRHRAHLAVGDPDVADEGRRRKEATPAFFRVVPGDYIQGPTDANFMVDKLNAKKVVLFDFQEPYSVGLADAAEAVLKAKGVTTVRLSTSVQHDRLLVARDEGAERRGHRLLPDAEAAGRADVRASSCSSRARRRRCSAATARTTPAQFKVPGSYVSNFAPDISGIAVDKALIDGWKKDNPKRELGSFGPPTYLAVAGRAERDQEGVRRGQGHDARTGATSSRNVKKVVVKNSILGGTFRFSTKSNDPLNAKFYIFQIQSNGTYKLVG